MGDTSRKLSQRDLDLAKRSALFVFADVGGNISPKEAAREAINYTISVLRQRAEVLERVDIRDDPDPDPTVGDQAEPEADSAREAKAER